MATAGKAILAILAGKGKPMSAGKPAMGDDEDAETGDETEPGDEPESGSKYADLLSKAFPDEDWSSKDRVDAVVELIHQCMDEG